MLTDVQKQLLLETARNAIEAAIRGRETPHPKIHDPLLCLPGGAFVTLKIDAELRGCIGYIEPVRPLIETVREVAIKAALEDFRFSPIGEDELSNVSIEISVLSPLTKITDILDIVVGKHGLLIEAGNQRGLLLPQVAIEQHWDRETFLAQTSRKAGLPPGNWRHPDTSIFIFTAEILREVKNKDLI
jgi:AmmeMemoRadiSam system protein A